VDAVLTGASSSIPQLGALSGMALLVILLLRREGTELARERAAHDAETAEQRAEITALRVKVRELDAELDEQRRLRRIAEDASGRHRSPA
jgi:hypothetical protein